MAGHMAGHLPILSLGSLTCLHDQTPGSRKPDSVLWLHLSLSRAVPFLVPLATNWQFKTIGSGALQGPDTEPEGGKQPLKGPRWPLLPSIQASVEAGSPSP